jgi:hypothetical protein
MVWDVRMSTSTRTPVSGPPTLLLAGAAAVATIAVVLVAGQRSAGIDGVTVLFAVWGAVPFLLLGVLAVLMRRRFPGGQLPLLVGGLAAVVVGVVAAIALLGMGGEPAPLVLIWSPLVQELLVGLGAVVGVVLHGRARR